MPIALENLNSTTTLPRDRGETAELAWQDFCWVRSANSIVMLASLRMPQKPNHGSFSTGRIPGASLRNSHSTTGYVGNSSFRNPRLVPGRVAGLTWQPARHVSPDNRA